MKIILAMFVALFVLGCSDSTNQEVVKTEEKSSVSTPVEVKEVAQEVVVAVKEVASSSAIDGKALYAKCTGCHGANGEKKALGKSAIIQDMDLSQIETALNGYKDGSYGGSMKGMMQGQVKNLDAAQITALSKYIESL